MIFIGHHNGQASSRPHLLPEAGGRGHRPSLREVRRQVRHLRLVRAALHPGANLRRVQLRLLPGSLRHLRWARHLRCLLLQGVHRPGEGPRRLPQDCQPRQLQDGPLLRDEKVRFQEAVMDGGGHHFM